MQSKIVLTIVKWGFQSVCATQLCVANVRLFGPRACTLQLNLNILGTFQVKSFGGGAKLIICLSQYFSATNPKSALWKDQKNKHKKILPTKESKTKTQPIPNTSPNRKQTGKTEQENNFSEVIQQVNAWINKIQVSKCSPILLMIKFQLGWQQATYATYNLCEDNLKYSKWFMFGYYLGSVIAQVMARVYSIILIRL